MSTLAPALEPAVETAQPTGGRWYVVTGGWETPDGGTAMNIGLGHFPGPEQAEREFVAKIGRAEPPTTVQAEPVAAYADRAVRLLVDLAGGAFLPALPAEPLNQLQLQRWAGQMTDSYLTPRGPLSPAESSRLMRFVPLDR